MVYGLLHPGPEAIGGNTVLIATSKSTPHLLSYCAKQAVEVFELGGFEKKNVHKRKIPVVSQLGWRGGSLGKTSNS